MSMRGVKMVYGVSALPSHINEANDKAWTESIKKDIQKIHAAKHKLNCNECEVDVEYSWEICKTCEVMKDERNKKGKPR